MITSDRQSGLAEIELRRPLLIRLRPFLLAASALGFATGLVLLFYATSIHSAAGRSDKATTILVGQALGNGHFLLHDWTLPPGNYWTSDAAFYAVAVRLFGLRPGLLFAEPAVVAAITISVGALMASLGRRGTSAVAGGFTVVALLAFTPPAMALWLVGNGFHIAAVLYSLLAFLALAHERFGWRWALAVGLLGFGMVGDFEIVSFAVVPLLLAGAVAMARERTWRSGSAQIAAAIASTAIGELALRILSALGSFRPTAPLPKADVHQMVTNIGLVVTYGANLLGIANGRFGTGGTPTALLDVHAVGGIFVVACLLVALWNLINGAVRGRRRVQAPNGDATKHWRLDDLLLLATLGSAAPFVILAGPNGVGIHFLAPPVVFASILAARTAARAWGRISLARARSVLATLAIAITLTFAAGVGYELSLPTPSQPEPALVTWLRAHDLHSGISGYWTAAITTVESGGAVTIRPVGIDIHGHVERMTSQSANSWYRGQHFQFFVTDSPPSDSRYKTAEWTWGKPSHVNVVGPYWVLVWDHTLVVSPDPSP